MQIAPSSITVDERMNVTRGGKVEDAIRYVVCAAFGAGCDPAKNPAKSCSDEFCENLDDSDSDGSDSNPAASLRVEIYSYMFDTEHPEPTEAGTYDLTAALLKGDSVYSVYVAVEFFDGTTAKTYSAVPDTGTLSIAVRPDPAVEHSPYEGCVDVDLAPTDEVEAGGALSCSGRVSFCRSAEYTQYFC